MLHFVYRDCPPPLPVFKDAHAPSKTALPKKASGMAKPKELVQKTHQTTIDGLPVASSSQDSVRKTHKKPKTKALHNTDDSDYITDDESDDGCKGGKKIFPLLLRISTPCHAITDPQKKIVRCIASKGCCTTWGWPRDKMRILKHAMHCGYLAKMEGGELVRLAIEELARKQLSLLNQLNKKMGIERKRTHEDLTSPAAVTITAQAPPLKRSKTELLIDRDLTESLSSSRQPIRAGKSFGKYRTEGRKALEEKGNKALIEFIVCCGIPPRIIQHQKFKNFVGVLNGNYLPPSRTTFEDSLVPSYAAATRLTVINYLKTCRDLTLTFDGGKLGKKKFFSVHATTAHRQSFCLELNDVERLSQTGQYICDLLFKWATEIGIYRLCCVSSDDTGNTNKGRRLFVERLPRVLNLADVCHNLHNACKDMCNLPEFQPIISQLRELLAFMSLSSYTLDWFDVAHKELHIQRGLQSVGETQFGSIYWSLDSIVQGTPAFTKIVRNADLGIDNPMLHGLFDDDEDVFTFQRDLK